MELMTSEEVAAYVRMTPVALFNFRKRGFGGPTYIKLGGRYFYRKADVDAWVDANTHPQPTAQPEQTRRTSSRISNALKSLSGSRPRKARR